MRDSSCSPANSLMWNCEFSEPILLLLQPRVFLGCLSYKRATHPSYLLFAVLYVMLGTMTPNEAKKSEHQKSSFLCGDPVSTGSSKSPVKV